MMEKSGTINLDKFSKAIALKDGSMFSLRAIRPDDEERLLSFFYRLSSRSIYLALSPCADQLIQRRSPSIYGSGLR